MVLLDSQVVSFAVEYSTAEKFTKSTVQRIEAKSTFFLSDRRMDNGTVGGVYETDVTGLQASGTTPTAARILVHHSLTTTTSFCFLVNNLHENVSSIRQRCARRDLTELISLETKKINVR